jgi:pyruvate dehydrogenase E2 component (dihydrolipoamide acetyltransferase)
MPVPVPIPRLGWNMEEGVFAGWIKRDGDTIQPGDNLFTLESDKASEDIESLDGGILRIAADSPQPGDKVAVGRIIAYLVQPGESFTVPIDAPRRQSAETQVARSVGVEPAGGPAARRLARNQAANTHQTSGKGVALNTATSTERRPHTQQTGAVRAGLPTISPRAKRIATELNIDWTSIRGSGRTGRIRERDVRAAARQSPALSGGAPVTFTSARRLTAERMRQSAQATVPVTLTSEADVTNLVNLRSQFQAAKRSAADAVPGYTDFFVKLAALALGEHPYLNARWRDEQLVMEDRIDIGIAVDTEAGLLVPVLRDAAHVGLRQLANQSCDLIARARAKKLSTRDLQGGTFTVSSLGSFGIDAFTPVINYPEIAILGVGRIRKLPTVIGEQIVVRERVAMSLTFDHCAVDGAPAARFLQTLCKMVEAPAAWLVP